VKKLLAFILTVGIFAAIVFVPPVVGRELLRREIIDIRDDVPKPIDAWLAGLLASVAFES